MWTVSNRESQISNTSGQQSNLLDTSWQEDFGHNLVVGGGFLGEVHFGPWILGTVKI